jgi:protein-S-isoprenylcysteine O-methyltransferase Ste14
MQALPTSCYHPRRMASPSSPAGQQPETPRSGAFRRWKLPAGAGAGRFFHDLVYKRYRFRQFVTIAFIVLLTIVGEPARMPAWFLPGAVLVIIGEIIRFWAAGHVKKDKVLANTGPYNFVRHPLYVGNHLALIGFCLASGWWWSWIGWLVIAIFFYPSAINHEDTVLHNLFGKDWEAWRARVRALIPRLTPYQRSERGEWSLKQCHHNGEIIIGIWLIASLVILSLRLP